MIIPSEIQLECFIGGTFSWPLPFFDDKAQTVPSNFSGKTANFTVHLYDGSSISGTADIVGNIITLGLTSIQTATLKEQIADYALSVTVTGSSPPVTDFLARGDFIIKQP